MRTAFFKRRKVVALLLLVISAGILLSFALSRLSTSHTLTGKGEITSLKAFSDGIFIYNYDTDTLTELTRHGDDRIYPASTGKLLTALLALDLMPPDTLISPGEEVFFTGENASIAYIRPGHTLTMEMLLEGMLLPSGNDAAYAIAAAGGRILAEDPDLAADAAVERFVLEMNAYAETLGCTGSHFTVPDGLAGEENYSTLHDMALIAKAAAEQPLILHYAGFVSDDVVYASGHTNTWVNSNKQLDESSPYYNAAVKGLKTGSLDGYYCLITLFDDGDHRYLIGSFGAPTDEGRYEDTAAVINQLVKENAKNG